MDTTDSTVFFAGGDEDTGRQCPFCFCSSKKHFEQQSSVAPLPYKMKTKQTKTYMSERFDEMHPPPKTTRFLVIPWSYFAVQPWCEKFSHSNTGVSRDTVGCRTKSSEVFREKSAALSPWWLLRTAFCVFSACEEIKVVLKNKKPSIETPSWVTEFLSFQTREQFLRFVPVCQRNARLFILTKKPHPILHKRGSEDGGDWSMVVVMREYND